MNSTTGDFSDIRKSITEELYTRGTQSSAKRKPFFPRKVMNIRPLNLNGIKKELEEGLEEEESQHVSLNSDKHDGNESEKLLTNLEKVENDAARLNQIGEEIILKDISNTVETDIAEIELEHLNKHLVEDEKNRNDIKSKISIENKLVQHGQRNDSFDLDFSALSISTPVKKTEISYVTPSANNKLKSVKSECAKGQFGEFVTPKIMSKAPSSSVKQTNLRTPFNNVSTKKILTPHATRHTNVNKRLTAGSSALSREEKPINVEEESFPANNPGDHRFNMIKVKNVEYIILNMLGKGGSSEVFQCYNVDSQQHVAIKCVSLQNSLSASGYINEVKLLQQLQKCDKIIKMYDYEILESQKKLLVVLEKGGEDLSTILKRLATQRSHIPMYMLLFYWMEMLYAVKQIHTHGVIHSDLKPSNFLKAEGGLKLIDFGIASSVQTDMTSVIKTTTEGSCNYISPEALNNDSSTNVGGPNSSSVRYKLHYKSDVWSLGCILYQFVYRRTPFQHIPQLWPKLATIMNPDHKIDYPDAQWVSPKIICTIQKCLQYNIKSRPSVDELILEYETILHNI